MDENNSFLIHNQTTKKKKKSQKQNKTNKQTKKISPYSNQVSLTKYP